MEDSAMSGPEWSADYNGHHRYFNDVYLDGHSLKTTIGVFQAGLANRNVQFNVRPAFFREREISETAESTCPRM